MRLRHECQPWRTPAQTGTCPQMSARPRCWHRPCPTAALPPQHEGRCPQTDDQAEPQSAAQLGRRHLLTALTTSACLAALPVRPAHSLENVANPTAFQRIVNTCDSMALLVDADKAAADFEFCAAVTGSPSASCSAKLRREALTFSQSATVLRQQLPALGQAAVKRGKPWLVPLDMSGLLPWPKAVAGFQYQVDLALSDMEGIGAALARDPSAARNTERLRAFAQSIRVSRELYNRLLGLAGVPPGECCIY